MHEKYSQIGITEDRVIEELSELIQAICKALRFGYLNFNPNDIERKLNLTKIYEEIEDVETQINKYKKEVETRINKYKKELDKRKLFKT